VPRSRELLKVQLPDCYSEIEAQAHVNLARGAGLTHRSPPLTRMVDITHSSLVSSNPSRSASESSVFGVLSSAA
jgi:hypothetical protein